MGKKIRVTNLAVGGDLPGGVVILNSCGTCRHALPTGGVGSYCNHDSSYFNDMTTDEWDRWSERRQTRSHLWCPEFEGEDRVLKLTRRKSG